LQFENPTLEKEENHPSIKFTSMVPNRGATAPQGAIYVTQGCRELMPFSIYH